MCLPSEKCGELKVRLTSGHERGRSRRRWENIDLYEKKYLTELDFQHRRGDGGELQVRMADCKSVYLDGHELQIRAGGFVGVCAGGLGGAHLDYATGQPKAEVQMSLYDDFTAHLPYK